MVLVVGRLVRILWSLLLIAHGSLGATDVDDSPEGIAHLLERMGLGAKPGQIAQVRQMGVQRYIEEQLNPENLPLPLSIEEGLRALPTLEQTPADLFAQFGPMAQRKQDGINPQTVLMEASQARLLRAIESPQQLYEVMVDFWYNHFNVAASKAFDRFWVGTYERDAIRPHAMGNFLDLLKATAKHPAMLFYLDNWQNRVVQKDHKSGINENYARELMELHTLGVNGGYTQADVIALAKILSGWGFRLKDTPRHSAIVFFFDPLSHDHSKKRLLGQAINAKGMEEGLKALEILAYHPATAKHISFKLAQYFVADEPNPALVELLAQRFVETKGDIKAVLQTLFESSYFWDRGTYSQKYKTPYQYVVAAVRASGAEVKNYRPLINTLRQLGMPIYGCQTPDGYKNIKAAWLGPEELLNRIAFASGLAGGRLPLHSVPPQVVDSQRLVETLEGVISADTWATVQKAPAPLRATLLLGGPEFMRRK